MSWVEKTVADLCGRDFNKVVRVNGYEAVLWGVSMNADWRYLTVEMVDGDAPGTTFITLCPPDMVASVQEGE